MDENSIKMTDTKALDAKVGAVRTAFLYILIGGLVLSALISVIAILIGEFNDVVLKALLTTFIFVSHSLLLLAIILVDKKNQLGKSLVSTTILITLVFNMFSTTLGTWGLWQSDLSWKMFLIYMLLIGSSFLISGTLLLRRAHQPTQVSAYATVCFILLLTFFLFPWILAPESGILTSLYFRSIGAITILTATSFSLTIIFNRIAAGHKRAVIRSASAQPLSSGLFAFNICVGSIVALFWVYGLVALISQAATTNQPSVQPYSSSYYRY